MRIISGTFRGRILKTVDGPGYRPAMSRVREALFSMLESRGVVWSATQALDVFGGSGSLAFEALSRGAQGALIVENAPKAVRCLQQNAEALGLDASRVRIIQEDAIKALGKRPAIKYDVVFIDPPYGKNLLMPTIRNILRCFWVDEGAIITAEVEATVPFDAENAHPDLTILTERSFGQTRVIVWKVEKSA